MLPTSQRRVCPACACRPGGVVATDCPLCEGAGLLAFGREAVGLGVELAGQIVWRLLEDVLTYPFRTQTPVPDAELAEGAESVIEGGLVRRLPETLYTLPLADLSECTLPDELMAARARRSVRA